MTGWHDLDSARDYWADAESISDDVLWTLLEVAQEQVIAYAPPLQPDWMLPPARYVYAQLRQAQNLYNAGRVDSSGGIGDGSNFVITPHPLDWHVKQILRPKQGRPRVR